MPAGGKEESAINTAYSRKQSYLCLQGGTYCQKINFKACHECRGWGEAGGKQKSHSAQSRMTCDTRVYSYKTMQTSHFKLLQAVLLSRNSTGHLPTDYVRDKNTSTKKAGWSLQEHTRKRATWLVLQPQKTKLRFPRKVIHNKCRIPNSTENL